MQLNRSTAHCLTSGTCSLLTAHSADSRGRSETITAPHRCTIRRRDDWQCGTRAKQLRETETESERERETETESERERETESEHERDTETE